MKKIHLLAITLALLIAFSSCKDEKDYGNPSISFKIEDIYLSDGDSLLAGEKAKIGIKANFNSNDNITNLKIKLKTDTEVIALDSGMNSSSFDYEYKLSKTLAKLETLTFIITDIEGHTAEISLNIHLKAIKYGEINHFSGIILGAQNCTTNGGFYSLSNNTVYFKTEAQNNQALIDLVYFYNSKNSNALSSPAMSSDGEVTGVNLWTTKNETLFATDANLSIAKFNAMQHDSLLLVATSLATDAWKAKAKTLAVGNIYYFKTKNSKLGIFKVNSVQGTDVGTVEIDLKIQK